MKKLILCITTLLLLTTGFVRAQFIFNGSFETGVDPGGDLQINSVDSVSITGWTVATGNIDYVGPERWVAGDGSRCLDLSGVDAGSIQQVVNGFTPGNQYQLSFLLAGNPEQPPYPKHLRVVLGAVVQDYVFDGIYSQSNLGWVPKTLDVTATGTSMTVQFISLDPGWSGPALDSVSISAVPEPAVTTFGGLLVLIAFARRWIVRARC
jgi:choice-of-anchor C domain-containing protein